MKRMSNDIQILLKYTLIWIANHAPVTAVWYYWKQRNGTMKNPFAMEAVVKE